MWSRAYRLGSCEAIGERAGYNRGLVTLHFGSCFDSKDALLERLTEVKFQYAQLSRFSFLLLLP